MKKPPSQAQMMNAHDAQAGEPNYIDESADSASNTFYPKRGQDAPAYIASNPRYWEHR